MKLLSVVAVCAGLVCISSEAATTQTVLSYAQAKSLAAKAEQVIARHHIGGVISVVDSSGPPIIFERLDGSTLANIELAPEKAHSAAAFGVSTSTFQQKIAAGNVGLLGNPVVVPLPGGEPVKIKGVLAGAIGVSTPDGNVDTEAAKAAVSGFDAN